MVGKSSRRGRYHGLLRESIVVVGIALGLSVLMRTFLFQLFYVPSESMYDTLHKDDKIVASRITATLQCIHRGDVVVFHDPGGWLTGALRPTRWRAKVLKPLEFVGLVPRNSGEDLVKRVIGIAGDHIVCCSPAEHIMVNGHELNESAYTLGSSADVTFSITVPPGRIFVMGDNRQHSSDSRFHLGVKSGSISPSEVRGVVVAKIWPLDRLGSVPAPETLTNPALNE